MNVSVPRFLHWRYAVAAVPLLTIAASLPAAAALSKEETIDKIAMHERELQAQLECFNVDIYAQEFGPGGDVLDDRHWLGEGCIKSGQLLATEFVTRATRPLPQVKPRLNAAGFVNMALPNLGGVDFDRYTWNPRGEEMMGNLRCSVWDLNPKESTGYGAFVGKVWVSSADLVIVRLDGGYSSPPGQPSPYLHFISVRVKTGPQGLWMPSEVFIDDRDLPKPAAGIARLKARVSLWGFKKQAETATSSSTLHPEEQGATADADDASRRREPRQVYIEIEQKVLAWMESIGLLAPAGQVEQAIEGIVAKLQGASAAAFPRPIKCRILLSTAAEWVVVGDTILISRSLVDTPRNDSTLALILAPAVAIVLQDRPIDAVSAGMLQNRADALMKLNFRRSVKEIGEAEEKALKLLARWPERDDLVAAAVYQRAAAKSCQRMPALFRPRFGNALSACNPASPLHQLDSMAPRNPPAPPAFSLGARLILAPMTGALLMVAPPPDMDETPFQLAPIDLNPRQVAEEFTDAPVFPPPGAGRYVPAQPPLR